MMALVLLPCDLPNWPTVQRHLTKVKDAQNAEQLVEIMHRLHDLCNVGLDPTDDPVDPARFEGLRLYVGQLAAADRTKLFRTTLPCMVNYALKLRIFKPRESLQYSLQQQAGTVELDRRFIASLVANCFFSTFPKRSAISHPTLLDVNFSAFFYYLNSPWQRVKFEAILLYFEALSEAEPTGLVTYTRKVMSGREFASLADWLGCSKPLCPVVVRDTGRIEDAEPGLSQVCFLSPQPGGDTLRDGRSQESLSHASHPELLASAIFQERLEDNESLAVSGCVRSCQMAVNSSGAPHLTRLTASARSASANGQICCVDAESYTTLPAAQYDEDAILRELNKAYLGFQQPKVTKRLSPIGESNGPSRHVSVSPALSEVGESPELVNGGARGLHNSRTSHGVPMSPLAAPPPEVQPSSQPQCEEPGSCGVPLRRPATIGGPTTEPPAEGSPGGSGGATRQSVLRLIGQMQRSIERELGQLGQQANSQIVSQIMSRIRTIERSQLVRLLSADTPAQPAAAVGELPNCDEDALLTVCEALMADQVPLEPLDGDYFEWKLEELAQERCAELPGPGAGSRAEQGGEPEQTEPGADVRGARGRTASVDTDAFFSACSSVDDSCSQDGRSADSGWSGSPPRYRRSVSPGRPHPGPPRRRSTFRDRLEEANRRAEREELADSRDSTEDEHTVATAVRPAAAAVSVIRANPAVTAAAAAAGRAATAADDGDDGKMSRAGSSVGEDLDEVADQLTNGRRWASRLRGKSRSLTGNSSRLSFSSDFSSDVEELCDKFGHWLEEPGAELGPRDLAVMRVTQRMLKRTLSDTFAGSVMDMEQLDTACHIPSASGLSHRLESDARQRKRACARSLSLSDQWARERLALEVARKLVEPSPDQPSAPVCAKPSSSSVVELLEAAHAATLRQERLCPAIYRYSEELASRLVPECVHESALLLRFHLAKHRRAYRKISARPERKLTEFPRRPAAAPPSPPPAPPPTGPLPLDEATVEGFSWTLVERLLEETIRQLPSPRRQLLKRLISGRAVSLDRKKGILKKPRSAVPRSRSSTSDRPPPLQGSPEGVPSSGLPSQTGRPEAQRRKSRRESFLEVGGRFSPAPVSERSTVSPRLKGAYW
ncbi:uncharacterized protein LOC122381707 [Amphibalanus amphitrite]|uniref:uncharacterized protein LOC122381707 n=1 Tax=Amphibalanus amphitrite TaxID=1232801 RepID=UPI001C914812|nr:uncharacterized protein LOC122381707 [Amphibalanus amphitrite]